MRRPPAELSRFLAAYDPRVRRLFLAARAAVLRAAPGASELVYDAYNAVAAAYGFSERLSDAFCHVAAYAGHVNLGFNRGVELPDPERLLAGSGARIRHVRIEAPGDLSRAGVRALVRAAAGEGRGRVGRAPARGRAIVKRTAYTRKRRPR
ncbi:MAG TPA: DUF1801 domain-containing protein [Myxococcota bacterium]|nr:DUF1801 domain-containing protein [Myxococcota bacterium]